MKSKNLFILFIGITLMLNTCEKDDEIDISFEEAIQYEALSEEEVEFFDNLESIELSVDEILLPNGLTLNNYLMHNELQLFNEGSDKSTSGIDEDPDDLINILFTELFSAALVLTDRKRYQYEEASYAPKQYGLAYSYGQRDHTVRQFPPHPPQGGCEFRLYGLDCSGFIFQLFYQSGVDLRNSLKETYAEYQRKPDVLKNAILEQFDELSEVLLVEDLGKKDTKEFKSGDIIYWLRTDEKGKKFAGHIGMVILTTSGKLRIAQSNGVSKNHVPDDCKGNYSLRRGPRIVNLAPAVKPRLQDGFGDDYRIVRISIENAFDFNTCYIDVRGAGNYNYSSPAESYIIHDVINLYAKYNGGFTGNTFNASHTERSGPNVTITGSIKAVLNEDKTEISSISWTEQSVNSTLNVTKTKKLEAINIPLDNWDDTEMAFFVSGKAVKEHINEIKDDQSSDGLSYTFSDFESGDDSYIALRISSE